MTLIELVGTFLLFQFQVIKLDMTLGKFHKNLVIRNKVFMKLVQKRSTFYYKVLAHLN